MHSMTGFGRAELEIEQGILVVEMQTVNRKHLDIVITLPKELSSLEIFVKKILQEKLVRGQVTARFFFSMQGYKGSCTKDIKMLQGLKNQWESIAKSLGCSIKDVTLPFLLEQIEQSGLQESYAGKYWENVLYTVTTKALEALLKMRKQEGQVLKKAVSESLQKIRHYLKTLSLRYPVIEQNVREKIQKKMEEFSHVSDHQERLCREVALYFTKIDVQEELVRLDCHLQELDRILGSSEESIGKQMLFLVQEMLREIHTACVKVEDQDFAHCAIGVKTELERVKEQLQNVQ